MMGTDHEDDSLTRGLDFAALEDSQRLGSGEGQDGNISNSEGSMCTIEASCNMRK